MSNFSLDFSQHHSQPLAARIRPLTLVQYVGQQHLLGKDKPLMQAIQAKQLHSMILWGPPGTGKTTLAELIAQSTHAEIERLSAVTAGIKEIRESIETATHNYQMGKRTILFIDEVHRFNKSQQDAFLPYIENGKIVFIGATTENPSFALNSALLSRVCIYQLKSLSEQEINTILQQAITDKKNGYGDQSIVLPEETSLLLAKMVNGDARKALNTLELMIEIAGKKAQGNTKQLSIDLLKSVLAERSVRFDKQGDRYYDLISALHKSIRGSAPDAALYWYARLLQAGGDPLYVARRLLAIASEDIGNADPKAMQIALAAWDCYTRVGAAEGERAIAQAIIYQACAPKSNAVYTAFKAAMKHVEETPDYDVPLHLRNAPTALMKQLGIGESYRYAHDEDNAYAAGESYFPEELDGTRYYYPVERGMEIKINEKINWLKELDINSQNKRY